MPNLPGGRAGRRRRGVGADHGESAPARTHAQTIHQLSPRAGFPSRNQLRRHFRTCSRARSSATKRGVHRRRNRRQGCFELVDRGRCSSTRWRDDAGDAGQAAPRPPGTQLRRLGGRIRADGRRARDCCDHIDPGDGRSSRASCARISLLPAERVSLAAAELASARRICRCW